MSKFCEECGSALEDNASFCDNCGTAVPQEPEAAPAGNFFTNFLNRLKSDKKFAIITGAIAVALVLVIVLICVFAGGGKGYTKAIDNYIAVMFKGDVDKLDKLVPEEYWEYAEDEMDMDKDDFVDMFEENIDDLLDSLEDQYGEGIKVTYEIQEEKELSEKKLEGIAEALEDTYDIDAKKVTAGYELEVDMTIEGDEDDDTDEAELTVIKYNGNWYMIEWSKYSGEYYAYFSLGSL